MKAILHPVRNEYGKRIRKDYESHRIRLPRSSIKKTRTEDGWNFKHHHFSTERQLFNRNGYGCKSDYESPRRTEREEAADKETHTEGMLQTDGR